MPLSEAFYLNWFKRRASMSASELPATPRTLSSSIQAALTLKSPTSTRASIPQLRGVPLVPTVLWPLVPLYNSPSQQIWPHYPYQCLIRGTFLVSPYAINRPNADYNTSSVSTSFVRTSILVRTEQLLAELLRERMVCTCTEMIKGSPPLTLPWIEYRLWNLRKKNSPI